MDRSDVRKALEAFEDVTGESRDPARREWLSGALAVITKALEAVPERRRGAKHHPIRVTTCAQCESADVQITAWINATTSEIIPGDGPTDQSWCPHCNAEVSTYVEDDDEVDPEWWASNGYRCGSPKCIPMQGCESCQLFVCPSCYEPRAWADGDASDPRCDDCFDRDPRQHVELVVSVDELDELIDLMQMRVDAIRVDALAWQVAAATTASMARNAMFAGRPSVVVEELQDSADNGYAMAREVAEEWLARERTLERFKRARARR